MNIETAMNAHRLIERKLEAEKEYRRIAKLNTHLSKEDGQITFLHYTDADGDIQDLLELDGDGERYALFDFLQDILNKRIQDAERDIIGLHDRESPAAVTPRTTEYTGAFKETREANGA